MTAFLMLAAVLFEAAKGGVSVKVDADSAGIDPAKSVFLQVEVSSPPGKAVQLPDLRDRVVGFSEQYLALNPSAKDAAQVKKNIEQLKAAK